MGSYKDLAYTFNPESAALGDIVAGLEELKNCPPEELDFGSWDPADRYYEKDFERDRLVVETDEDRGQVYLHGRTHSMREMWNKWVKESEIGDGELVIILHHEVERNGVAWVYEWDNEANQYRQSIPSDEQPTFGHLNGEDSGRGAIAAHRANQYVDAKPARRSGKLIRWGESKSYHDGFVPPSFFEMHNQLPSDLL